MKHFRDFDINLYFKLDHPDSFAECVQMSLKHSSPLESYADDEQYEKLVDCHRAMVAEMTGIPVECVIPISYEEFDAMTPDDEEED